MTAALDQQTCMDVLGPHLAVLHDRIQSAFEKYLGYPAPLKADHDDRAAASCVHAHIITGVHDAVADIPGLALIDARGLKVLNVRDRIVARFKKVDASGRSRSYPTRQARRFDRQLGLPNLPPAATRLTIGYEPDPAFSAVARVIVSCPLGSTILWCSQIVMETSEATWIDITPRRIEGTEPFRRYDDGDAKPL
jgi:hypothetical protein